MEKQYKPVPDVEALRYKGTPDKPDIKIFVSHRIDLDSEIIDNPLYIPVRCGAVYDEREGVVMLGDDTGDNISEKRERFCELTVQYWAWKNIEADYYGLCHYRRYHSFSPQKYKTNENGQIVEKCPNRSAIEKYCMDNPQKMEAFISKYDVIYGDEFSVAGKETPLGRMSTVKTHWDAWINWLIEFNVLDKLRAIIANDYPQYLKYFDSYLNGNKYVGYNCFIMKKKYFFEMCEFQFGVLSKLDDELDYTYYSENKHRTCGFMGEILYGTYILYIKSQKDRKIIPLQLIFFSHVQRQTSLSPFFEENNIPIVLMSSDYYVPYLCVFLSSLASNSSKQYHYDIVVLEKGISDENKNLIQSLISVSNISIRFFNPCYIIGNSSFYIAHEVYAEEAYYRMLTPWILSSYEKAIVMDCDIVVKRDLADLYKINVDGYLAAGVKDVVFQGVLNGSVLGTYEYVRDEMKMSNPYEYVNTGVLLMNLKKWREEYTQDEIITLANTKKFRIQEQDILNTLFEGKIKPIEIGWNYYVAVSEFLNISLNFAPLDALKEYKKAGKNPYLIHYAGVPKPWTNPEVSLGYEWWSIARDLPIYEVLFCRLISPCYQGIHEIQSKLNMSDKRSGVRKFADKLLPPGSRRRTFAKFLLPKGSLRWKFCKRIYCFFAP